MDFFVSVIDNSNSALLECLKFCDTILGVGQYYLDSARYSIKMLLGILLNRFHKIVFVIV